MAWNWTQATHRSFLSLHNQPDVLIRVMFRISLLSLCQNATESYVDANDFAFHDTAQSHSTEQE